MYIIGSLGAGEQEALGVRRSQRGPDYTRGGSKMATSAWPDCPTVVVQAEAGREGIYDLLMLLGHAPARPNTPAPPQVPAAKAVGVLGYAGTGKRAVCKAIRQELKATAPWLLDACRLNPVHGIVPPASSALHAVVCTNVPRGAASATSAAATVATGSSVAATEGVEPVDVIKEFLTRAPQQNILQHFRIPAFEGADAFLTTFCKDRKLKNKKGKWRYHPS